MMTFVICDHTNGLGRTSDGKPLTRGDLNAMAKAIGSQLRHEFALAWGGRYAVRVGHANAGDVKESEIEIAIFQTSDEAGAAGYHALTPQGKPYGRAFLDDCEGVNQGMFPVSVVVSHECLETAADPGANRYAVRADGETWDAIEVCDAVEDVTYQVDGVLVSDFLLPCAFSPGAAGPWSHKDSLPDQYAATAYGYRIIQTLGIVPNPDGKSWRAGMSVKLEKRFAFTARQIGRKKHPASRTSRRGLLVGGAR